MHKIITLVIIMVMMGCDDSSGTPVSESELPSDVSVTLITSVNADIGSHSIQYNIRNLGGASSSVVETVVTIAYLDANDPIDGISESVTTVVGKTYSVGANVGELAFCTFNRYGRWRIGIDIYDGSNAANNHDEFIILVQDPNSAINDYILGQWHMWIQYNNNAPPAIEYWDFNIEYNSQYRLVTTGHNWFEHYISTNGNTLRIIRKSDFVVLFTGVINTDDGTVTGQHADYPDSNFIMTRPPG